MEVLPTLLADLGDIIMDLETLTYNFSTLIDIRFKDNFYHLSKSSSLSKLEFFLQCLHCLVTGGETQSFFNPEVKKHMYKKCFNL